MQHRFTGCKCAVVTDVDVTDVHYHRIHDHYPDEAAIEVARGAHSERRKP